MHRARVNKSTNTIWSSHNGDFILKAFENPHWKCLCLCFFKLRFFRVLWPVVVYENQWCLPRFESIEVWKIFEKCSLNFWNHFKSDIVLKNSPYILHETKNEGKGFLRWQNFYLSFLEELLLSAHDHNYSISALFLAHKPNCIKYDLDHCGKYKILKG